MTTAERIQEQVQKLPEPLQDQTLVYIEFLIQMSKTRHQSVRTEDLDWSHFSLAAAMRGIEDEDVPIYDESDLKERWV
jgi:hypothetical protein